MRCWPSGCSIVNVKPAEGAGVVVGAAAWNLGAKGSGPLDWHGPPFGPLRALEARGPFGLLARPGLNVREARRRGSRAGSRGWPRGPSVRCSLIVSTGTGGVFLNTPISCPFAEPRFSGELHAHPGDGVFGDEVEHQRRGERVGVLVAEVGVAVSSSSSSGRVDVDFADLRGGRAVRRRRG